MPLRIQSIKKLPKRQFEVVFNHNDTEFRTLATLQPKRGNAVQFHDPLARSALIDSGRDARLLCDLILQIHQGRRPKLPCLLRETPVTPKQSLTIPPRTMLKVG